MIAFLKHALKELMPPLAQRLFGRLWRRRKRVVTSHSDVGSQRRAEDAELKRLASLTPNCSGITSLLGRPFRFAEVGSFLHLYQQIFRQEIYRFRSEETTPYILDCGANIGVSVFYWKKIYDTAHVVAFEPSPEIFEILKFNTEGLKDVCVHNAAIWTTVGRVPFYPASTIGGHLADVAYRRDEIPMQSVKAVRLADFIDRPVDFLKMDIEGAEVDVILECVDLLPMVDKMFLEFHSFVEKPQRMGALIQAIEHAGFRIHAHSEMPATQPFLSRPVINAKDFRLNLFCFRD